MVNFTFFFQFTLSDRLLFFALYHFLKSESTAGHSQALIISNRMAVLCFSLVENRFNPQNLTSENVG